MKAIGFRVEPKRVHWAVVRRDGDQRVREGLGVLPAPASFFEAQALDWYRNHVNTLLDQYKADKVAVRYAEPSARQGQPTSAHRRARIEGVILEASYSKGKEIVTGPWATWSALLKTKSAKEYLARDYVRGVSQTDADEYKKEALLAAMAVLE
jgi:hypothetical protein